MARWRDVLLEELKIDEGFREFAYPDPLSPLAKATKKLQLPWGFKPATSILNQLPENIRTLSGKPWTVGYGKTKDVTKDTVITESAASEDLQYDIEEGIDAARSVFASFDSQLPARKNVLANMGYNLGATRLSGFHSTIRAVDEGDYESAALHMLNSLWARQVGKRARRLADRMRTGELP